MAREGISKTQVFNAADAISAAGQAPTVASIRAKLGTGSYTTITTMLRDWKSQADTKDTDIESDVPEEITEALSRAAGIVWKAAQDHFRHELTTVKKEAERATAQAQAQTADALAEIENLELKLDSESTNATQITQALADLANAADALKTERAELTASLKAAESRIKEQGELLRRLVPEPKKTNSKEPTKAKAATPRKQTQLELPKTA